MKAESKTIGAILGTVIFVAISAAGVCYAATIAGPESGPTTQPISQNAPTPIVVNYSNEKDTWDKINVGATIASAIGTLLAAIFAWKATIQAKEAAEQSRETASQTNQATKQAEKTARDQRLAELFGDIQRLTYLTAEEKIILEVENKSAEQKALDKQVGEKVIENLNIMEKIAFCWDKDLVDRAAIEDEVRPFFTKLYEQIENLPRVASLARDGKALIKQTSLATKLRNHFLEQSPK